MRLVWLSLFLFLGVVNSLALSRTACQGVIITDTFCPEKKDLMTCICDTRCILSRCGKCISRYDIEEKTLPFDDCRHVSKEDCVANDLCQWNRICFPKCKDDPIKKYFSSFFPFFIHHYSFFVSTIL